jgi:Baseplate J-like protein
MKTPELCDEDLRRQLVRDPRDAKGRPDLNGIDFVEISDDQLTLRVYFLAKAPDPISKNNVVISGGRRVTGIKVTHIDVCRTAGKDLDDCLKITVDKPGDFSDYTLRFVETDKRGRPTDRPLRGFDPRFADIIFSFKIGCKSDLDCLPVHVCQPRQLPQPEISYLAKDYSSFRQIILDRLSLIMPDWRERHVPDLGIALVEVLAYAGDHLSYYQDAVATEAYLDTARQRISVRRHARLVDYLMHEGCNARAWVFVEMLRQETVTLKKDEVAFITVHNSALPETDRMLNHDRLRSLNLQLEDFEVFEAMGADEISLFEFHNEIKLYTWGDFECCLPRGATSATLADEYWPVEKPPPPQDECGDDDDPDQQSYGEKRHHPDDNNPDQKDHEEKRHHPDHGDSEPKRKLNLRAGDVLIFEEIINPGTGEAADVDPAHRHAVLLTRVSLDKDNLNGQPVVEIEWGADDALPFPLCLSAIGNAPDCERLENVTIARGNIVLVDHGRTIGRSVVDDEGPEDLGSVPARETLAECSCTSCIPEVAVVPGLFRPGLKEGPLTFSQPLPLNAYTPDESEDPDEDHCPAKAQSAASLVQQDPRQALPQITLRSLLAGDPAVIGLQPRYDLLSSGADDNDYVVEMDNQARARLRFGDGEMGRAPQSGEHFVASYRVGNGAAGNVGAEAISHIVLKNTFSGITLRPRNPLVAAGGAEPETTDRVKLFAPYAFRATLQRAITAEDYAAIAMRHPRVQSATAILRWTGAWYEVVVAVDPKEKAEADETLLDEIECMLRPFRRIGHDVRATKAIYVPLDIELTICVKPGYLSGHVKADLMDLFSNRLLADGRKGFFHPDNLTFGAGIMVSKLVALARSVTGVENVVATRLQRFDQPAGRELADGILKTGSIEIARLDNDRQSPENGKIKFNMVGGR